MDGEVEAEDGDRGFGGRELVLPVVRPKTDGVKGEVEVGNEHDAGGGPREGERNGPLGGIGTRSNLQ